MDATDQLCAMCDKTAVDAHHLTGRDPDGCYLDPDLVVPLCHDDHELAHDDLRHADLDRPDPDQWSPSFGVAFRLCRVALFLARTPQHFPTGLSSVLAKAQWHWADELSHPTRQ